MQVEKIQFIGWLVNRLIHKHQYSSDCAIIKVLHNIQSGFTKAYVLDIEEKELDKIISKYYVDFNLETSPDINMGYTEKQRYDLRNHIKNLVSDIVNKNIPQDFTIKDK